MTIAINDHRKIFSIQEEFNTLFPFLKIIFFAKSNTSGGSSSEKEVTKSSKSLGECRTEHIFGNLTITPNMTVGELTQRFGDEFGLTIGILRKSGTEWVPTTEVNGMSLEAHNLEGEGLEKDIV